MCAGGRGRDDHVAWRDFGRCSPCRPVLCVRSDKTTACAAPPNLLHSPAEPHASRRTLIVGPMENVILIVHLLLALALIGVVLMQRSEGGGLGMGGGGGGAMSQRSAATAMGKLTWILAIAFIITSLTLTVISARNATGTSILDRVGGSAPAAVEPAAPGEGLDTDALLPPPSADGGDAPSVPRAD